MKPTAYLVRQPRAARSSTVPPCSRRCAAGRSPGPRFDVYDIEPLPLGDALRRAPNTVLTPHLGYVTDDTYPVFYGEAVEDIAAFAKGAPIRVLTA